MSRHYVIQIDSIEVSQGVNPYPRGSGTPYYCMTAESQVWERCEHCGEVLERYDEIFVWLQRAPTWPQFLQKIAANIVPGTTEEERYD